MHRFAIHKIKCYSIAKRVIQYVHHVFDKKLILKWGIQNLKKKNKNYKKHIFSKIQF